MHKGLICAYLFDIESVSDSATMKQCTLFSFSRMIHSIQYPSIVFQQQSSHIAQF